MQNRAKQFSSINNPATPVQRSFKCSKTCKWKEKVYADSDRETFLPVRAAYSAQFYWVHCCSVAEAAVVLPRRIGAVYCGRKPHMWQTQRRREEGSSHFTTANTLKSMGLFSFTSLEKFINTHLFHVLFIVHNLLQTSKSLHGWANTHCVSEPWAFGSQCGPVPVKRAAWEEPLWWWLGSAVTLLLRSQPLPEAANGFAYRGGCRLRWAGLDLTR